jgi:hypothetical protein
LKDKKAMQGCNLITIKTPIYNDLKALIYLGAFFYAFLYLQIQKILQSAIYNYTTKLKYMNSIIVPVRMTPVQKKELTEKANENHLKLSTWIRQTILNNLDNG